MKNAEVFFLLSRCCVVAKDDEGDLGGFIVRAKPSNFSTVPNLPSCE